MSNIGLFVSREDNWLDEAVGRQFEITHVDNTEAALEILEESYNHIGFVVVDLELGEANDYEFFKRIRRENRLCFLKTFC